MTEYTSKRRFAPNDALKMAGITNGTRLPQGVTVDPRTGSINRAQRRLLARIQRRDKHPRG